MFGAIYTGLSGLTAYSKGLQQVSNNVTNLNTSGFKGSTVTFQNFYASGDAGGLSYTVDTRGSGGGVGIGDPLLDLHAGELRQTDRDLDLAIDGKGFLVLLDGENTLYTRTGSFEVDREGYIVLSGTNYRLATLDSSGHAVSLSIDSRRTSAPKATTTVKFTENLSIGVSGTVTVSDIKVYDATGAQHVWKASFDKGSGNEWTVKVTNAAGVLVKEGIIGFDNAGNPDPTKSTLVATGANGLNVTLDFSAAKSWSGGSTASLKAASVDGYGVGELVTIAVNAEGQIELSYSNEQKDQLGAVALADFRDTAGLSQMSNGLFRFEGSGERTLAASDDPRVGQVLSKRLEASNVDLSKQFGDLILIQRGFQASSQIISVSNDMIQQLFGIRGQG